MPITNIAINAGIAGDGCGVDEVGVGVFGIVVLGVMLVDGIGVVDTFVGDADGLDVPDVGVIVGDGVGDGVGVSDVLGRGVGVNVGIESAVRMTTAVMIVLFTSTPNAAE